MTQRTQAELEATYDAQRLSPVLPDDRIELAQLADQLLDEEDEETRRAAMPIPPVPAGYSTDNPMIARWDRDIYMVVDRRDGEMAICYRGELGGTILPADQVLALFRFFSEKPIAQLLSYHWSKQMRATGSPELISLLDWIDAHYAQPTETAPLATA